MKRKKELLESFTKHRINICKKIALLRKKINSEPKMGNRDKKFYKEKIQEYLNIQKRYIKMERRLENEDEGMINF